MHDVYIAEAMMETDYAMFNTPEKKEAFIDQVFRKYGVTEAQWDTSLSWYSDRIDIYIKMNDSVKARLQREQQAIDRLVAQQYSREQEKNRGNQSPSYIPGNFTFGLQGDGMGFSFRLDSAEFPKSSDPNNFDFSFDILGISQQHPLKLKSMLILEYKDTTVYRSTPLHANQRYSLPVTRYIENDTLQRIIGFIQLEEKSNVHSGIQAYNISMGKSKTEPMPTNAPRRRTSRDGRVLAPDSVQKR